jgi:hypothetical protein
VPRLFVLSADRFLLHSLVVLRFLMLGRRQRFDKPLDPHSQGDFVIFVRGAKIGAHIGMSDELCATKRSICQARLDRCLAYDRSRSIAPSVSTLRGGAIMTYVTLPEATRVRGAGFLTTAGVSCATDADHQN